MTKLTLRTSAGTAWYVALWAVLVASTIAEGAVMARLWSWFVVPLGLPRIGVAHAVWLSVIVALRGTFSTSDEAPSYDRFVDALSNAIARCSVALAVGYLAHLAMVSS